MPKNLEAELDDFIRWLATMPHHFADFKRDPEAVMDFAQLSEMARATLQSAGTHDVIRQVRAKLDQILSMKEVQKQAEFNRDHSAPGFGGTVISKESKEPE